MASHLGTHATIAHSWGWLAIANTAGCRRRCEHKFGRTSTSSLWLRPVDSCMPQSSTKSVFQLDYPTMSALSILLVALGACALARLLLPSFPRNDKSGSGIRHYPHIIPFLGLDLGIQIWMDFYRGQYSEGTRRRHVSCGRTFSARNLRKEYIYTIEPQNILTITKHRSNSFEKSDWASEAAKHIGSGILLNEGEAWSRSRKMLKPIFSSKVTDDPTVTLEPHVSRLIVQMKFLIETEGTFEFQRLADMFMLDVVTEFLFGKSTCCLEFPRGPEGEEGVKFLMLVRSFDGPSASVMALGQSARISLLLSKRQLNETVVGMKAFFRRKLVDVMSSTEDSSSRNAPWSVFRMMKAEGIPDEQVQAELQNIFFAGWDTTSVLLANTVYALLRHQNVQRRLREEIGAFHGMAPTKQDLNRMEYLRLVINEGVCLLSPLPPENSTVSAQHSCPGLYDLSRTSVSDPVLPCVVQLFASTRRSARTREEPKSTPPFRGEAAKTTKPPSLSGRGRLSSGPRTL